MTDLVWSFAPWLVFLLASRITSFYGAVAAGALAAVVVLMRAIERRRVHMLDVASTVYFATLGATLIAIRPVHVDVWARYAQAGSHIALTLLVFGSIVAGRPFTEAYAGHVARIGLAHQPIPLPEPTDLDRVGTGLSSRHRLAHRRRLGRLPSSPPAYHRSLRLALLRLPLHPEAERGSRSDIWRDTCRATDTQRSGNRRGGEGTRTLGLRLAKPPLYQLSYTPACRSTCGIGTVDPSTSGEGTC